MRICKRKLKVFILWCENYAIFQSKITQILQNLCKFPIYQSTPKYLSENTMNLIDNDC